MRDLLADNRPTACRLNGDKEAHWISSRNNSVIYLAAQVRVSGQWTLVRCHCCLFDSAAGPATFSEESLATQQLITAYWDNLVYLWNERVLLVWFVISRWFNLRIDSRHPYTTILCSDKADTAILHSNFMIRQSKHSNQLILAIKGRNKRWEMFWCDTSHAYNGEMFRSRGISWWRCTLWNLSGHYSILMKAPGKWKMNMTVNLGIVDQ